jgi:O-antigen biosynthesis protein WbqP
VTGWAQINGRDELEIPVKVRFDAEYLARQSLAFDFMILLRTVSRAARGDGVTH